MPFMLEERLFGDIIVLRPQRYADPRGWFMESFRADQFQELGLPGEFPQDNHSYSTRGVIRGMHFQHEPSMGKLLRVISGAIQLVEVDIRKSSPTYGQHVVIDVSDHDGRIVYIPPGFANGFCVVSDDAHVVYKCTTYYNAAGEGSLNPLDPTLGIAWRTDAPIVSDRDRTAPGLGEFESFFE